MLFRLKVKHIVAVILVYLCAYVGRLEATPRFGLWVEAEGVNQPFKDRDSFEKFKSFVSGAEFTDLFCQVYRGGRAWFPSMLADSGPYYVAAQSQLDPLRETLNFAHARNQKVHAWLNILRLEQQRKVPILQVLGEEAVLTDSWGNSLVRYDADGHAPGKAGEFVKLDTPGIWLNPSSPRVRAYLLQTVRDLIQNYPDLDGLHLDMIRFPFPISVKEGSGQMAYGYSLGSIADYRRTYPGRYLESRMPEGETWDSWRRSQVTLLVVEIRELLRELAPQMELSVAGLGNIDRAYRSALQDWRGWLQSGVVDLVLPMNYTTDITLSLETSRAAVIFPRRGQVLVGLGAWLMLDDPNGLIQQARGALDRGASGVVLFSYSNLENGRGKELIKRVGTVVSGYEKVVVQARSE